MILLFGEKANKNSLTAQKTARPTNKSVENSGILAMSMSDAKSLLTMGEYDTYISSSPVAINYAMAVASEAVISDDSTENNYESSYSQVLSFLSSGSADCGFGMGFGGGEASFSDSGCGCSSFSSVG